MDDIPARGFPAPQGRRISLGKGLAVPWAGEGWLTPQPCWQAQGHGAMCDHYLVGNLGKCGATLPESLPPHFKERTGGIRQRRQLCCGLWLAQAWEEW